MDVIWEVGSCVIKFPSLRSRVKMRHVDEVLQSNPVLVCYLSNRHYYPTKYSYKCFKYSPWFTLGNDASTDKKIYQIFLELLSSRLLLQGFDGNLHKTWHFDLSLSPKIRYSFCRGIWSTILECHGLIFALWSDTFSFN